MKVIKANKNIINMIRDIIAQNKKRHEEIRKNIPPELIEKLKELRKANLQEQG